MSCPACQIVKIVPLLRDPCGANPALEFLLRLFPKGGGLGNLILSNFGQRQQQFSRVLRGCFAFNQPSRCMRLIARTNDVRSITMASAISFIVIPGFS
jgi:hypothetical protein